MAKNYNIRTVSDQLAGAAASDSVVIGSAVPAGMTRYVTFIMVTPEAPANNEGSRVFFCSAATAAAVASDADASTAMKMAVRIASAVTVGRKDFVAPPSPDTEHPLFTVASGAFLSAYLASAATMSSSVIVFVQYYDE